MLIYWSLFNDYGYTSSWAALEQLQKLLTADPLQHRYETEIPLQVWNLQILLRQRWIEVS